MRSVNWMRLWLIVLCLAFTGLNSRVALSAETVTYYYTNQQGTPLATADASGHLLASSEYKPYGSQAAGMAAAGPGYTGHVNDPDSGLVYMQARYYDPVVGRFLSGDSVAPAAGNPATFSRFAYAVDDPVGNVDTDGRCVDGLTCDSMARSIATHPDAFRPLGPAAAVATGVMALPTVVLGGSAAVRVAVLFTAKAGGEEAGEIATAAARQAAADARAAGATNGATSGLVTESGEVFTGASTNAGGPGAATNKTVQEVLDSIPEASKSPYHGCCGEINAMSKALNAGSKLEGSTVSTVKVAAKKAGNIMEACSTCQMVADKLGVKVVQPL